MKINLVCFIGSVGSGKTTGVKAYEVLDDMPVVRFMPGQICRGVVGDQFFNRPGGNTPEAFDDFIFDQFLVHVKLLRKLAGVDDDEGVIVSDGWPRNELQAGALIQWLHRCEPEARVYVHHLLCDEKTWERRLRNGRWLAVPEQEALDRTRYAESISDSIASIALLRSAGPPFVTVESHGQELQYVERR